MTKKDYIEWNGPIYCQSSRNKTKCKELFYKICTNEGANKACANSSDKRKCFKNFQKLCHSNPHVYQKWNGDVYCKNSKDSNCLSDFKDICIKNAKKYCDNTKHKSICIHKLQRVCFGDAGKKSDQALQSSSSQDTQISKYCKGLPWGTTKDKCLGRFKKICNNSKYFCQFMKSPELRGICITNFKNVCKHDSSSQYYDSDSSTQSFSGTGDKSKGPYYNQKKDDRRLPRTLGQYHGKIGNAHIWMKAIRHFSAGAYCKHLKGNKHKECLARFARLCAQRISSCSKSADKEKCRKAFADMCFNIKDKDTYQEVMNVLKAELKKMHENADSETQSSFSDSSYDSDSQTSDDSSYDSSY